MTEERAPVMPQRIGRVVILQTSHISEVVFSSPLVHAVKEANPEAHVAMMVRGAYHEVASCIPGVDQVLSIDSRGRGFSLAGAMTAARKIREGKYEVLLAPHHSFLTALLSRFSKVPLRVGYRSSGGRLGYTRTLPHSHNRRLPRGCDLELLKLTGITATSRRLRLQAPLVHGPQVAQFLEQHRLGPDHKLIGLCIGAKGQSKRWPAVYYASLIESLAARRYVPVLFCGNEERQLESEILSLARKKAISYRGRGLGESAALLFHCEAVVGGDAGLTHMAHALGTPTLLVYGPTDYRQDAFGDRVKILNAVVKCRPCPERSLMHCPLRHHDCMRLISPERILDGLDELIEFRTPIPPLGVSTQATLPAVALPTPPVLG